MKKNTRELLLDSAFQAFYKHGYQGANIATILTDVGINKGSMYHFFKSKKELGLAVIEERIEQKLFAKYSDIESVKTLFDTLCSAPTILVYGCPLNKMSQEMIYIDSDFQKLLSSSYEKFELLVKEILTREYISNADLKSRQIIATYEGALMIYHLNQNEEEYVNVLRALEETI